MLKQKGERRSPKAVSSSPTRATAPPMWWKSKVLAGELIGRVRSEITSMAASVRAGR